MKKFNRIFALIMALAMVLSLAACGSAGSSASEKESAASTVASAPEADTPEEVVEDSTETSTVEAPAAEDTFTGAISAEDSSIAYPISEEGLTLSFWSPFNSTMPGIYNEITDIHAVSVISEATGVDIDWVTVSGAEMFSSFNLMAATGDYCDLITSAVECYSGGAVGALEDGIIVDLSDYIEENAPEYLAAYETRNAAQDILTDDGRYACLYGAYDQLYNSQGYVIRQDWLDELGLDTPVTYDDYFEVLSAFKDAYDCTDAFMMDETCQDEYHTSGGFGVPGYKTGNFGAGSDLYQVEGEVRSSFNQEAYREYLAEMNKWYEAGLFSADFVTLASQPNHDDRMQLVASGNSGVWYVGATSIESQQESIADAGAKIAGVADPVKSEGEINHFSSATIINKQCNVSVSTDCDDIEAALQYLNYFYTDEGIRLYNYGVEGESYNLENGEVVYTDAIMTPAEGYTPFTMTEAHVLVGYICSVTATHRADAFSSDAAIEALDIWNSTQDNAYTMPAGVALSADESSEASSLQSDLYTYVATCIPKFILGEMDIETQWDEFVESCESMGLQEIIDIYQTAYDRFAA